MAVAGPPVGLGVRAVRPAVQSRRRVLYAGYAVRGWLMLNLPVPCTGLRWKRLLPSGSRTKLLEVVVLLTVTEYY